MSDARIEATRTMAATPAAIFEVLRDPEGHVAIDSSGMLQSAEGAPVSAVEESFVVHMDREALGDVPLGHYDVEVVFTKVAEPTEIEWTIHGTITPPLGHVFGYLLEPLENADGGPATKVTSYCDWSDVHPDWLPIFPVIDQKALRATLGVLERTVKRGYPRISLGG
ncbi:polyketide cyclase [Saccharopolyspora rhizosphaerae]|uniref:Polyketide cyclase n=1 Tax=Saccharopolyspora rhizosphaerae TaxID=2492662 RepID=A0A3R8NU40_9PSEU|nr:polyketide cyclase [Saccharopolyspora rhizosphaerae]RRO13151.1 polyketide cyclase [Saccharopolyspora rhizosphaerae]